MTLKCLSRLFISEVVLVDTFFTRTDTFEFLHLSISTLVPTENIILFLLYFKWFQIAKRNKCDSVIFVDIISI